MCCLRVLVVCGLALRVIVFKDWFGFKFYVCRVLDVGSGYLLCDLLVDVCCLRLFCWVGAVICTFD